MGNDIACVLRWGVALVGVIVTGLCLPSRGTKFQVQVVHRRTALLRGPDFEGSQDVALIQYLCKLY